MTQEIKNRLEKKTTFVEACKELKAHLLAPSTNPQQLAAAVALTSRVQTLLKARYSNVAYWRAGLDVYKAAVAAASATLSLRNELPKLTGYVADAEAFLATDTDTPGPIRQQTLGELLLGLPPPQETPSHLSDAGLVLENSSRPTASAPEETAAAAAPPPQQQPPGIDELLQRLQQHNATNADGQQQQQADGQPEQQEEQGARMDEGLLLETLAGQLPRAELEALLASFTESAAAHQAPTKPPASKKAVASLPVLQLVDNAALESVGGKHTACPVCTEELQLQDNVQQLPCKHVFHVPCLAPWLEQNNSCPVCRHELPTDDHAYEARKELEVEEEETRRGAQAALSHNEFMYV